MVYPGRRCALPWAMLCKPVGLSKPFALRAVELAPSVRWRLRVMAYPGRRCALPWARLCKPVGLSKPFALRAVDREHIAYQSLRPAGC
jgi:hypothetical protein